MNKQDKINQLLETIRRLRAPNGCPWDRAQTHQTLRPYLIEEAYEVLDILDKIKDTKDLQDPKIKAAFREELGDLLMQVLLHSEMASEEQAFDFAEVAESLNEKLIRRHPHVFGEIKAENAEKAVSTWEAQKLKEKASKPEASILDGVPRGLPALQKAARVIEKVTRVGFQWKDLEGPLEKINEEFEELKAELSAENVDKDRVQGELGDLLFSICNLAWMARVSPEDSLRGTLQRFDSRFRFVEKKLKEHGKTPDQSSLEEMDQYWNEAKKLEKGINS